MQLSYLPLVVLSVCAITFYRAGRHERSWGLLWAALSILVSTLVLFVLKLGLLAVFAGQVGLFVAITFQRMSKQE